MTMFEPRRCGSMLALAITSVALAACGGSSHASATRTAGKSTKTMSASGGSSIGSGPVRATLTATNHDPAVGKNWTYTVMATDAQGHPLSGTVTTEFAFQGAVVGRESPPTHRLKNGRLKDTFKFPARAVGYPLELQLVVHTSPGSVTLDWPVTAHK